MGKNIKIFLLALIGSSLFFGATNSLQMNLESFFYAQISQPLQETVFVKIPPKPKKPELDLRPKAAIVVKINGAGREKILFQKNIKEAMPIASLTKLMTALTIMNNEGLNFSDTLTVSAKAASRDDVPVYGNLKKGESFSLSMLLHLMLFYSSNDAAFTLSEVIGTDNFIDRMNQTARSIGLKNTKFVNPSGLDPDNNSTSLNRSTVKDLSSLSKYILQRYPLIFKMSITEGLYPRGNSLSDLYAPEGQVFIGGKTGYTEIAGGCMLVLLQDDEGNTFIYVTLGSASSKDRIQDMQKLINWTSL